MYSTRRVPFEPLEPRTLWAAQPAAAGVLPLADGTGSISGTVYYDVDNDARRGPGEAGLPDRVAYLDLDEDNDFDPGERWVTTDAAGAYTFAALGTGRHAVRVLHPEGWRGTDTTVHFVALQAGQVVGGRDFGSSNTGRVSAYAFNDLDGDGRPFAGIEPKLAGRTLYLDADGNARLDPGERSGVTNQSGLVDFLGVLPGSYAVRQVVPAGWTDRTGGLPVTVGTRSTGTFHLGSSGPNVHVVSGTAFHDLDADGTRGPGEPGLAGQTVFLDVDNSISLSAGDRSVVTGADGAYRLDAVPAGQYALRGMPPSGWFHTTPLNGGVGLSITGDTVAVAGPDFGAAAVSPSAGAVHGAVFADADGDGSRDPGEAGVSGLPVYLDLDGDRTNDLSEPRGFTNSRGEYAWGNVAGASVGVGVLATRPGWVFNTAGGNYQVVPLAAGRSTPADFGTRPAQPPPGSIGGVVFQDHDRDGQRDLTDRGMLGQTVWIDQDGDGQRGPAEPTTTTNADGRYLFAGLPAGTHALRVVVPAPYEQTAPSATAAGTWLVTLASPDDVVVGRDFGIVPAPSAAWVTGRTYEDVNANGVRDPGEWGYEGTVVYVDVNRDGVHHVVDPSNTAAGGGSYALPPLAPGEHRVRLVNPSGTRPTNPAGGFVDLTLAPGQFATQDLGFTYKALVRGTVFHDADEDGARDPGEPGLAGRTLFLDADADAALDPGEQSAVTDAAGAYTFPAVTAGTYVVRQVVPPGSRQTLPAGAGGHHVILGTGQVRAFDFGTVPVVQALRAAADAHVRDGTFAGTNYGGAGAMEVRLSSTAGNRREAYLRFDLSQVPSAAQIASAKVRLWGRLSAAGSVSVGLFPVASNAWTESGIKWSAKPPSGTAAVGAVRALTSTAGGWVEYDVTSYLRQQKQAGAASVSLALKATNYTSPHAIFASDEALSNRPELRVTQGTVVVPPPPPPPTTGPAKLAGAAIGTAGSYNNNGNTIAKALDGSLSTYFDAPAASASGAWVGLDLGSARKVTQVRFAPRGGWASRMVGGRFQASNSATFASGVVDLHTITAAPTSGVLTTVNVNPAGAAYRYVRYLAPANSYGNVAEAQFFGT